MAKILLIASGILLLFSSILGVKNLNRLKDQQVKIKQTQETADANAKRAEKTGKDLKSTQVQLETSTKNAAELETKLSAATQEADNRRREAEENARRITEVQAQIEQLQAAARNPAAGGGMSNPTVELENKIRELEAQVAEAKQVQGSLQEQAKIADANLRQLQKKEDMRQRGLMASGLTGRVLAVDRNWNFVVLDLGDRNGVVSNAEMVITRGGSAVGKVRITNVEPSQSIADVVPNSVPPGLTIERGDRVVYAGAEPRR